MKIIPKLRKHHYLTGVGVFLIAVALLVGTASCDGGGAKYNLTMAVGPAGNGTATDLTDASPYTAGTPVAIKAVATAGYGFRNWTAPAGGFINANAAQTTFTMPAQNVTVTANFAPFVGGGGTEGDPYQIANWYQLHMVRNYRDSHFILVNNLDSTTAGYTERASSTASGGKGWQPIGSVNITDLLIPEFELINPFTGEFDGQGYEIRDLFIDRPDEDAVGLFGSVDMAGVIKDVEVLDADITGNMGVGILIGGNLGSVSSSCSSGSVGGYDGVGGLMGGNIGNVSDSHSSASVNSASNDTGGLVGLNAGNVHQSYATGNVIGDNSVGGLVGLNVIFGSYLGTVDGSYATGSVDGSWSIGGLVGYNNEGDVSDCFAISSVDGVGDVGGLVGQNKGTISNSYATGSAAGEYNVGGLAGWTGGAVSNSYATNSVTGGEYNAGGLVGWNGGTVSNSYATGGVTGNEHVGGLTGHNSDGGTVSNSYATGSVTGNEAVGGLVGWNEGSVSNSFWDTQTSGQDTSDGGTGKTTAQMEDIDTFTGAGWNIVAVANPGMRNTGYIWNIVDDETYAFLSWQPV